MSSAKHIIALLFSVAFAYIWLTTPFLKEYSLQAFAIASLCYFVIKKFGKSKVWHILPNIYSLEMMFITFSVLLLIGATGNTESIFYPFTYIHLFILVMSYEEKIAITIAMASILFHYAMEPTLTSGSIAVIITVPMMLLFFLFAKRQYDDARLSHSIIEKEEKEIENLSQQEHTLESFISTFLKPKLETLEEILSDDKVDTEQSIRTQVSLMANESEKILDKIKTESSSETKNSQK